MASRGSAGARHYMVVANQTLTSDELVQDIRSRASAGQADFWFVVPATPVKDLASKSVPMPPMPVMGGVLSIPAPPEEAQRLAREKLDAALRQLTSAGVNADGEVGDADPIRAVEAAMRRRRPDEIIVSTLPERMSRWLRQDLPRQLEQKVGVPVTHVLVPKFTLRESRTP